VTRYLSVTNILEIHRVLIDRFGGSPGVRDANLLRAAAGRPQNGYYVDGIEQAAAFFESLSGNHPFIDGNKRIAFTATAVFLGINGYDLLFTDAEAYAWLIKLYETGQVTKSNVASWLRDHCTRIGK